MAIQNERLTSFVERVERLLEDRAAISGDIKEVYAEMKAGGYDPKIVRILIRERAMDTATLQEQQALLETYREALGHLAGTPLGKASEPKVRRGVRA